MMGSPLSWHRSEFITTALRAGRRPDEIRLLACDGRGSLTSDDRGTRGSSEHCGASLDHLLGEDGAAVLTLQDVWDAEEAAALDVPP
jgi:hypothetical protein